jgi:hypothetical protein
MSVASGQLLVLHEIMGEGPNGADMHLNELA